MYHKCPVAPVEQLLAVQQPSLSLWYGEPLADAAAADLHHRAQLALRSLLCMNRTAFPLHVLQLVCGYWRHAAATGLYESLAAAAGNRREQAFLELVYGQLLMARKLQPAGLHLARGFELAVPWLASSGYLELLTRHELLNCLGLSNRPAPAQGLAALLSEAAVIRRLRHRVNSLRRHGHCDTVG